MSAHQSRVKINYKCLYCSGSYNTNEEIQEHVKICSKFYFQCLLCGSKEKNIVKLNKHLVNFHNIIEPNFFQNVILNCTVCQSKFKYNLEAINYHSKNCYSNDDQEVVRYCTKCNNYINSNKLTNHTETCLLNMYRKSQEILRNDVVPIVQNSKPPINSDLFINKTYDEIKRIIDNENNSFNNSDDIFSLIINKILSNKEGDLEYFCENKISHHFQYIHNNELFNDKKADKLSKIIIPLIKEKLLNILSLQLKNDLSQNEIYNHFQTYISLINFFEDNYDFRMELIQKLH